MKTRFLVLALATGAIALSLFALWTVRTPRTEQPLQCLDCHRSRNINTNEGIQSSQAFCYECHKQPDCQRSLGTRKVSLQVESADFRNSRHQYVACIHCHTDVARSPHKSVLGVQCLGCHPVGGDGPVHSEHLRVRCEACHTASPFVERDQPGGPIKLAHVTPDGVPISLAAHKQTDVGNKEFCDRCHHAGNMVGAPAAVLPSKSFLCIVCHYSPLAIGHPMFWAALIIGLIGLAGLICFWFRGSVEAEKVSAHKKLSLGSELVWSKVFSREFFSILKTIFLDVLLQRRILAAGVRRWAIHSLIYYSFLARFLLSVFTLIVQKTSPGSQLALSLIDKNNGFIAATNDVLGLFILVGVLWALLMRFYVKPDYVETKEQDTFALALIGLLTLTGFLAEGMRIYITGIPVDVAASSFVGYLCSRLFALADLGWQTVYGYMWYFHAACWAVFIAYLPFGKLRHIVTTPLSLLINYKKA